jgi:O-antigen ligase
MTFQARAAPAAGAGPALAWRDEGWLAVAAPALIFIGHMLYGAMRPEAALLLTAAASVLLGICLLRPKLRRELQRLDGLVLPAVLFLAVILVAVWSLTPFVPGGPHPVWAYLNISPGAATVDRSATTLEIIKLLGLACVFLLGAASGGSDTRARLAVNAVLVLGVLFAAWAFFGFVTNPDRREGLRLEASFLSANTAGTVFAALFVLCSGPLAQRLLGSRPGTRGGAPVALAALLFLITLFMTASRGGLLATASGFGVMVVLLAFSGRLKWSRALLFAGGGALAMFALLAVGGQFLLTRLMGHTQEFGSRTDILKIHWQAFLESPLFGYGLGSFDVVNRMLLDPATFPKVWTVRAAHNIYLAWLEQGGLIAAVPMFACIGVLILTTLRKAFRRSRMVTFLFALAGVDAVFLVHGATDFALEMFSVASLWTYLLGLQFSLAQASSRR